MDRYVVEAPLGEGAMAKVYRVRHRALGSAHALKVLTTHNSVVRERLIQEGRLQARLAHPNIVAVTDLIDVRGSPGLIMEYVDGPTLSEWLEGHRPTLAEAEEIFAGIVAAVEHAHAAGVVHRDLKPSNVLLAAELFPRVADFGLARVLDDDRAVARTGTGVPLGTPAYMAPEQIRDARSADHRADVFSLGCILYELVTGRPAFEGELITVFDAVVEGRWAGAAGVVPGVPARVDAAIRGALATDVDRRISDCATLRSVLAGEAALGPTSSCWEGWPEGSARAGEALAIAEARARREGRAWVSLGDVAHGLAALGMPGVGGSVLFAEPRLASTGRAGRPVPVPGLAALRDRLRPAFGASALDAALGELVARCSPPSAAPSGSLTSEDSPVAGAVTGLVVLLGPEQGRWLSPVAGEHIGRHRREGGPEHALYTDRSLGTDPQVHGRHLRWLGDGVVEALHAWRHGDGALRPPRQGAVPAGERVRLVAGDEVWLSPATGLRALERAP